MGIATAIAKNGQLTCSIDGVPIHSSFDPDAEARRFVESSMHRGEIGAALIVGGGLDYLVPHLRAAHPRARIVSLQCSRDFAGLEVAKADASIYPGGGKLALELDAALEGAAEFGLAVYWWRPSLPFFDSAALADLKASVERWQASLVTGAVWGRRWLSNAFANAERARAPYRPRRGAAPVLVACAGPSLEATLDRLMEARRKKCFVIAVSSALPAFAARGLAPDLVVTTDPGAYSVWHLHEAIRQKLPVAAPLSAYPADYERWLPIGQGTLHESLLLDAMEVEACSVPENGTASGTALLLALRMSSGPIYLAGLDLADMDLRSHARPHGFDPLFQGHCSALRPLESAGYGLMADKTRIAGAWRGSRSLATYAGWFSAFCSSAEPGRIRRIHPSPVEIRGTIDIDSADALAEIERAGGALPALEPSRAYTPDESRIESVAERLEREAEAWIAGVSDDTDAGACANRGASRAAGLEVCKLASFLDAKRLYFAPSPAGRAAMRASVGEALRRARRSKHA